MQGRPSTRRSSRSSPTSASLPWPSPRSRRFILRQPRRRGRLDRRGNRADLVVLDRNLFDLSDATWRTPAWSTRSPPVAWSPHPTEPLVARTGPFVRLPRSGSPGRGAVGRAERRGFGRAGRRHEALRRRRCRRFPLAPGAAGGVPLPPGPSGCGRRRPCGCWPASRSRRRANLHLRPGRAGRPHKRNVNTVFQHFALFPHMSVAENVAYGLRQKKEEKSRSEARSARRSRW